MREINIKDKNNQDVFIGDRFMVEGTPKRMVTVVDDFSEENMECDRDYDVEDKDGDRVWNAYMVIVNGVKLAKDIKAL